MKMKTLFMILLMGWLPTFFTYGQRINIPIDHGSMESVLNKLMRQGNFTLTYVDKDVCFYDVQLSLRSTTPEEALDQLCQYFPLRWTKTNESPLRISLSRYYPTELAGRICTIKGEGMEKLSVVVKRTGAGTVTDSNGYYHLAAVIETDTLVITGINIDKKEVWPGGRIRMDIFVDEKVSSLDQVTVYHDGYEDLRSHAIPPVSAYQLASSYQDGITSTDILSPLAGRISGLLSGAGANNGEHISLRGISTLFANRDMLCIVDKFPFDGNKEAINPYDMENPNALKDAPASVLWGARSANGVLVYTSKTGVPTGKGPFITFDYSMIFTGKPNTSYNGYMSSTDYTDLEKQFFDQHFYDGVLSDANHPAVTPVVEVLDSLRRGLLTLNQANAHIDSYRHHNSEDDLSRWFYQPALRQQFHVSVATGNTSRQNYLSLGYDQDPTNLRRNQFKRITVHDSYHQLFGKFELSTILHYADIYTRDNNPGASPVTYPYAFLNQPVNVKYPASYIDTAGGGRLQNWEYIPTQELSLADNSIHTINYYGQLDVRLNLGSGLSAEGIYRYMNEPIRSQQHYSQHGFYLRDLVNHFTDLSGPEIIYPVPIGDLLASTFTTTTAEYLRGLLNFTKSKKSVYDYNFQAGAERSEVVVHTEGHTLYGYDASNSSSIEIDPITFFPDYINGIGRQIPYDQSYHDQYTRYLSFFSDLHVNWKKRFSFYAAAKKDGTNIVGVKTNRKWTPFWAVGIGYDVSRQPKDIQDLPDQLKLRGSAGCNGNVGSRTGNLVTQQLGTNEYGDPQSGIANPPDPLLSWERTYMLNAGIDVNLLRDNKSPRGRIQANVDIYFKNGTGLLGSDTLPPSSGLPSFFGNVAKMRGHGVDVALYMENVRDRFRWSTNLLVSYTTDRVTRYPFTPPSVAVYTTGNTPRTGYSSNALFGYRSAGLDPESGNPRGFLGNQISEQYEDIVNGKDETSIRYGGSNQPSLFGSFLNTCSYKQWTLSLLINFKAFYFFRRNSINYYGVVAGNNAGNSDFEHRWMRPGDERRTMVPSSPDSVNDLARSTFYAYSTSLITRADCIRVQHIRLSYHVVQRNSSRSGRSGITLYAYINQPHWLWTANHYHIDPEAANYGDLLPATSYALGAHLEF